MEKAKKQLKTSSLFVLLFAGLSLMNIISALTFGDINSATIPEGAPDNILQITKMLLLIVTVVLLKLPRKQLVMISYIISLIQIILLLLLIQKLKVSKQTRIM